MNNPSLSWKVLLKVWCQTKALKTATKASLGKIIFSLFSSFLCFSKCYVKMIMKFEFGILYHSKMLLRIWLWNICIDKKSLGYDTLCSFLVNKTYWVCVLGYGLTFKSWFSSFAEAWTKEKEDVSAANSLTSIKLSRGEHRRLRNSCDNVSQLKSLTIEYNPLFSLTWKVTHYV